MVLLKKKRGPAVCACSEESKQGGGESGSGSASGNSVEKPESIISLKTATKDRKRGGQEMKNREEKERKLKEERKEEGGTQREKS